MVLLRTGASPALVAAELRAQAADCRTTLAAQLAAKVHFYDHRDTASKFRRAVYGAKLADGGKIEYEFFYSTVWLIGLDTFDAWQTSDSDGCPPDIDRRQQIF